MGAVPNQGRRDIGAISDTIGQKNGRAGPATGNDGPI